MRPLFILSLAIALAACTPTATPAAKEKSEKINIGYSAIVGSQTVPMVMKDAGIFDKYGLDPEIVFIAGGSPATMALIAGDIQIGSIAGPSVVEAVVNGAEVSIIIGISNYLEHKLVVKGIDKPADLKGKKIGILRLGDITETAVKYYLKQFGLEADKDVALIQVGGQPERMAAMTAGVIDGTVVSEPEATRAKKRGLKELGTTDGLDYQAATVSTSKAFIKSRPETVKKFVRAFIEGIHFYKTNKEATMKSIASHLKLQDDMEAVEITYNFYLSSMPETPYPTAKGVQAILDELAPKNEKAKTIKPTDVIDSSFVKELDDSGFIKKLYGK